MDITDAASGERLIQCIKVHVHHAKEDHLKDVEGLK